MLTIHRQTTVRWIIGPWAVLVALLGSGCEWSAGGAGATESTTMAETTVAETTVATTTASGPTAGWPAEITGTIHWLDTDVSGWAQTASLNASVGGGTINLPYTQSKAWPAVDGANANPWAIVNYNGQWYAATFEWLRYGQTAKPMTVLSSGGHIKIPPLSGWRPHSGERIGLMVSGLARSTLRNVKERSNIVMVTWP